MRQLVSTAVLALVSLTGCVTAQSVQSVVTTRADGVTLMNGNPFFPLGFYDVLLVPGADDAKQLSDLSDIAAAGFNTVHASANDYNYTAYLNKAAQLGVSVITEIDAGQALINAYIPTVLPTKSVLGWDVANDADNGRFTPGTLAAVAKLYKTLDPSHYTFSSIFNRSDFSQYIPLTDAVGVEIYPLHSEILDSVTYTLSQAETAAGLKQHPYWAILQTFAQPRDTMPTYEEVRNMTYQAILNGATGILYYSYAEESYNLKNQYPALWSSMKSIPVEMSTVAPFLLNGQRSSAITTKQYAVYVGMWTWNGQALVIVLNSNSLNSQPVTFSATLPASLTAINPQFGANNILIENNSISGRIAAGDVQVYLGSLK